MPTGYTAPIADGISFKEYAMGCARAFGALVMMRDEPQDAEIPEAFNPSTHYSESLEKEVLQLKELMAMDSDTAKARAQKEYEDTISYHKGRIAKNEALAEKYKAMLAEAQAYKSPSPDHDNFKQFMIDQILESISFDCGNDYHYNAISSARLMSAAEWIIFQKKHIEDSIEYYTKEHKKEVERTNTRNEWVKQLRESLK